MKVSCKESSKNIVKEKIKTVDVIYDERNLFCIYCNNLITNQNFQITMNNSHKHTFPNPHGIVFEIACFKETVGCSALKESSYEFSWFSGYNWRIAVCSSCLNHLGWLFTSNSNSFFGLIIEKIYYK
ncbi:MAG: hypothetical protein KAJ62_04325 [Desulfobacteraceae bacterium]|nr:hypothetical protein [Desulfobacteraceae bacterium]MCK5542428.1 hypothetical protein [Desulfobacterales bacterium]